MRIVLALVWGLLLVPASARAEAGLVALGPLPVDLRAAAATSRGFVAIGTGGAVVFVDADGFVLEALPSRAPAVDVWVASTGQVFVLDRRGSLFRREGAAWIEHRSGCESTSVVAGTSARDVLVGGADGCLRRFDGERFVPVVVGEEMRIEAIRIDAGRTFVGASGSEGRRWFEVRRSATAPIPLPVEVAEEAVAVHPAPGRGLFVAGSRLVSFDGRHWTTHYEDGPADPVGFHRVGGELYATSATGLFRRDGAAWVRMRYEGNTLLALTRRTGGLEGLTSRGEIATIGANETTVRGAAPLEARSVCHRPEGTYVVSDGGEAVRVSPDGVRIGGTMPEACIALDSTRERGFVRDGESFAFVETPAGTSLVRSANGTSEVIADPWALARLPGRAEVIGGASTRGGELFIAGTGFFVGFRDGRMHRHRLGRSLAGFAPQFVRQVGDHVLAWGAASDVLVWDENRFRAEPTVFGGVVAVTERDSVRTILGSPRGTDVAWDYDEAPDMSRPLRASAGIRIGVRRAGGYYADAASRGDLTSALAGLELGVVERVVASEGETWMTTALGLARFDGHGFTLVPTYESHRLIALVGSGARRVAVTESGRVLFLEGEVVHTERTGVRASATAAFVDSAGVVYVGGRGYVAERRTDAWSRSFGHEEDPSSEEEDASVVAFAELGGRVHALLANGTWLVRADEGFVSSDLPAIEFETTDPDGYARRTTACAILPRDGDRVLVVSCDGGGLVVRDGDDSLAMPLPAGLSITSASCLPEVGCVVFTSRGALRLRERDLPGRGAL